MDFHGLQKRKHYYVHLASLKLGIPYSCSLEMFCTFTFQSSSLGLFEGALVLSMLVVEGTPTVNGGITVPIFDRLI